MIHSASESNKYPTDHKKIDIVHVLGSMSMCTLEIVYEHINASVAALPAGVGVGAEEECYLLCPCWHAGEGGRGLPYDIQRRRDGVRQFLEFLYRINSIMSLQSGSKDIIMKM